ncbi:arylalkylamine N-acetyltransferase-like 2 isoform X3 [Periplaneta americana]|uniref:arylalkylamine N-acetyltransferase-like 2 isoform X3 n=1 Tax=Periplaneta americana TaxID=6978 RepID=UPI0037E8EE5F
MSAYTSFIGFISSHLRFTTLNPAIKKCLQPRQWQHLYISQLHSSTTFKMSDGYDIVTAKEGDKERIADFLRKHYYPDAPMHIASGASPNRKTDEIIGLKYLSQGTSFLAVSKDGGHILGTAINYDTYPKTKDVPEDSFAKSLTNEAYIKVENLVHHLEDKADIWNLTGADRGLYIQILAVDRAARGKGIAKALTERTFNLARSMDYPMIWIMCHNMYSIRLARSMGMHAAYTLPFSEYKDNNGKLIMNIPYPNTECVVFVHKLNS